MTSLILFLLSGWCSPNPTLVGGLSRPNPGLGRGLISDQSQRRVQDFRDGGGTVISKVDFPRKLHENENERIWAGGGAFLAAHLRSATESYLSIGFQWILACRAAPPMDKLTHTTENITFSRTMCVVSNKLLLICQRICNLLL